METQKDDYVLTMFEACEKLGKSKKTLGRYIRRGLIRPRIVKSLKGTPEYRFSELELQAFKDGQPRQEIPFEPFIGRQEGQIEEHPDYIGKSTEERQEAKVRTATQDKSGNDGNRQETKEEIDETRQEPKDKTGKLEQERQDGITGLIAETIKVLREQLQKKDNQLEAKDRQIDSLLERNREMNILLKFLQDKYPALEAPKQRRGRKAKTHTLEAEAPEETEIQPEGRTERQEPQETPGAPKGGEDEPLPPAPQEAAAEEVEKPEEEEKQPKKESKKKGFWKKLFTTTYNLP